MKKRYWIALVGVFGLGISGATTVQAAGDANGNLSTVGPGFAVGADGTEADARSVAEFEVAAGQLSLISVPNLHFEKASVSQLVKDDLTLAADADEITNDGTGWDGNNAKTIQVADYRGSNAGWHLTANLGQFTHITNTNRTLQPLNVSLSDGSFQGENITGLTLSGANFAGNDTTLINAEAESGTGTNTATFTGASLTLAKNLNAFTGTYKAAINWSLAATPTAAAPDSGTGA